MHSKGFCNPAAPDWRNHNYAFQKRPVTEFLFFSSFITWPYVRTRGSLESLVVSRKLALLCTMGAGAKFTWGAKNFLLPQRQDQESRDCGGGCEEEDHRGLSRCDIHFLRL